MNHNVEKITLYALLCWISVMFFSVLQFDLQLIQGFFTTELIEDFNLSSVGLANLSTSFFYVYILMQIPVGIILSKYKIKYILPISAFVAAIGCIIFGLSHELWLAYVGRFLMGGGSAFAYVAMLLVIRYMLPQKYFIILIGISEFVSLVGAGLLENVYSILIFNVGWRLTMVYTGILLLILAIIYYLLFAKYKSPKTENILKESSLKQLKEVLCNKKVLLACLYGFAMYSIVSGYASLWAVPSLKASFLFISQSVNPGFVAANIVQMILIGIGIGSPILGWVTTKYFSLKYCMLVCAIISFIVMIFLVLITVHNEISLIMAFLVIGLLCSAYVLAFPLAEHSVKPGNEAIALAAVNLCVAGGNIILQPLLGSFMDWHHVHYSYNIPTLTNHDYNFALWVIPIMYLVAIISIMTFIFIDRKRILLK